jgi:hypothetical protein
VLVPDVTVIGGIKVEVIEAMETGGIRVGGIGA